jgi:hypothetical protein
MFGTAIRCMAKKPKPKMKPIELKTPPEQTQTITRVIFDVVKEHGPLTIAETWDRVKVLPAPFVSLYRCTCNIVTWVYILVVDLCKNILSFED